MEELYIVPSLIFFIFCGSHSLFASVSFKKWLFGYFPGFKPYYRLSYNLLAVLILAAWLISLPPDTTIYRVEGFWFIALVLLQISALILAIISLAGHGMTFFGVTQLKQYLSADKYPNYLDEPERGQFIKDGMYAYMRHPLYTFSMIVLMASPIMTYNLLFIIVCVALYFWIGSIFEERNLVKRFGSDYKTYQKEIPRFIPWKFLFFRKQ